MTTDALKAAQLKLSSTNTTSTSTNPYNHAPLSESDKKEEDRQTIKTVQLYEDLTGLSVLKVRFLEGKNGEEQEFHCLHGSAGRSEFEIADPRGFRV